MTNKEAYEMLKELKDYIDEMGDICWLGYKHAETLNRAEEIHNKSIEILTKLEKCVDNV